MNYETIKIPKTDRIIYLRKNTSDFPLFLQIFVKGQYQIKLDNPSVIIDLGANIGLTSLYLRLLYPNAKIISVEPDKSNFDRMILNLGGLSDIYLVNKGIGSYTGKAQIIQAESWAIRTKRVENLISESANNVLIDLISVNDLMSEYKINKVDLLKIDVEGAEYELFNDNSTITWLPKISSICIELHDHLAPGSSKAFF